MGVKFGLLQWGRNRGWGCRGRYLGLRGTRLQGDETITRWFSWPLLLTKYYLGDQINKNWLCEHVALLGESRGEYMVLMGNPDVKRPLVRSG